MLGSATEAEDIVQDVWLRWQETDRSVVRNATAFLVATTTRVAINVMKSARSRRETYVGTWLPEPVDTSADPGLGAERGEALEFAVLLLLEKLTPTERAAYVLFEAFGYSHREIAGVLNTSEENTRQLVTRARKHLADGRRAPVTPLERRRLFEAFVTASKRGDVGELKRLFAADVAHYSDGGGLVRAARVPVLGRDSVAKLWVSLDWDIWAGSTTSWIEANGQQCMLTSLDGKAIALATIDASAEGIDRIMWFMRPSKLAAVLRQPRVTPD
jgi:RNA polymerase sigma-70 factor (ECF subfamily)